MYLLGRRVDFLVGLGQCQLRGVLLVNLEYDVAQANARFIGQATGGHLQAPKDVDWNSERAMPKPVRSFHFPQIKEPQKPHGASFEAQLNGYLRTLSLGSENIRDARTSDTDDMYTRWENWTAAPKRKDPK